MPRTIPTNIYSTRTLVTNSYTERTKKDYMIQELFGRILLESGDGAILLENSINNLYSASIPVTTNYS